MNTPSHKNNTECVPSPTSVMENLGSSVSDEQNKSTSANTVLLNSPEVETIISLDATKEDNLPPTAESLQIDRTGVDEMIASSNSNNEGGKEIQSEETVKNENEALSTDRQPSPKKSMKHRMKTILRNATCRGKKSPVISSDHAPAKEEKLDNIFIGMNEALEKARKENKPSSMSVSSKSSITSATSVSSEVKETTKDPHDNKLTSSISTSPSKEIKLDHKRNQLSSSILSPLTRLQEVPEQDGNQDEEGVESVLFEYCSKVDFSQLYYSGKNTALK